MQYLSDYTKEEIDQAFEATIVDFQQINQIDMNRMQLQLKYARQIIDGYHEGYEDVLLVAPTGVGKSILAFFLTIFMTKITGMSNSSYIMTSNKFLQQQYQRDIEDFNLPRFAMLKGQSNYKCTENNLSFTERACINESMSKVSQGSTSYKCWKTCPYLTARSLAINADTTVFNYSYWLTTMNFGLVVNPANVFQIRPLSIFDECHVMGNIVQDMFTVNFNPNKIIKGIVNYTAMLMSKIAPMEPIIKYEAFRPMVDLFTELRRHQDDQEKVFELLIQLQNMVVEEKNKYGENLKTLNNKLPYDQEGNRIKSEDDKAIFKFKAVLVDVIAKLGEMLAVYKKLGTETIVIQFNANNPKRDKAIEEFKGLTDYTAAIQCTNEAQLVQKAVHTWTHHGLFMSATLGDPDDYALQIGLEKGRYLAIVVPQVFTYEKSPIYKVTPMISMSYKDKASNMPRMIKRIEQLINHHKGERGLIHTGNFEIMRKIEDLNHPRVLTYNNSYEKEDIIKLLESKPDAVVCGPSLVEGVDLKNELCRFMIFAKVPYMSLADKLTKKKMEIYENWYNWTTMSSFMQGLGRPIRNKEDWCTTYLLDASFNGFFNRYRPQKWINDRIKLMESTNIGKEYDPEAEFDDMLNELYN